MLARPDSDSPIFIDAAPVKVKPSAITVKFADGAPVRASLATSSDEHFARKVELLPAYRPEHVMDNASPEEIRLRKTGTTILTGDDVDAKRKYVLFHRVCVRVCMSARARMSAHVFQYLVTLCVYRHLTLMFMCATPLPFRLYTGRSSATSWPPMMCTRSSSRCWLIKPSTCALIPCGIRSSSTMVTPRCYTSTSCAWRTWYPCLHCCRNLLTRTRLIPACDLADLNPDSGPSEPSLRSAVRRRSR